MRTSFCFQYAEDCRGECPAAFSFRLDGICRYSPFPMLKCRAGNAATSTISANLSGSYPPFRSSFFNRYEKHKPASFLFLGSLSASKGKSIDGETAACFAKISFRFVIMFMELTAIIVPN